MELATRACMGSRNYRLSKGQGETLIARDCDPHDIKDFSHEYEIKRPREYLLRILPGSPQDRPFVAVRLLALRLQYSRILYTPIGPRSQVSHTSSPEQ